MISVEVYSSFLAYGVGIGIVIGLAAIGISAAFRVLKNATNV